MNSRKLVLDASPIFNVLGTGAPERILASLAGRCVIEEATLKEIHRNPFDNSAAAPLVRQFVANGYLTVVRMGDSAYAKYLDLVAALPADALGRGESAALAYADSIGGIVVIDDRKARRVGESAFPGTEQWSSVEFLQYAAQVGGIETSEIAVLVRNALANARMHVLAKDRMWLNELGVP